MGTDNIEDLVSFSKTPAGRMEKIIKEGAKALLHLELQRIQAEATLMDGETIWSNIRVFCRYLEKLEAATNKYKQAISDLIVNDTNLKMAYTSKLIQQLRLTDPILVQLQTRINFLENKLAPTPDCVQTKVLDGF